MKTIFYCFLVFGAVIGYVVVRFSHIDSYIFKNSIEKIAESFCGMFLGAMFSLIITLAYLTHGITTSPDYVASKALRPVVFYDSAKQCEFFIERNKNEYVILEDK